MATGITAPGVQLSFKDGSVWLAADHATVGQILAEWVRVGGTRVVNGDRVVGGPLTLDMRGVPEIEALEVVLRSASGFIASARPPERAAVAPSLSRFDRIMVLPVGTRSADSTTGGDAPSLPPAIPSPGPSFRPPVLLTPSGAQRIVGPDGQPVPDDQDGAPAPAPPSLPDSAPTAPGPSAVPIVPPGAATPGTIPPAPRKLKP